MPNESSKDLRERFALGFTGACLCGGIALASAGSWQMTIGWLLIGFAIGFLIDFVIAIIMAFLG